MNNQERMLEASGRAALSLSIMGQQMGLTALHVQRFGEAVERLQKTEGGADDVD